MIKLVDQLSPMGNFAVATATDIVCSDNERLQDKIDNGTLGGDTSQTVTEAEYLALPEEDKLNNSYYLYDIGVHYKNGVAYSRKKPIQLTMEEYKALKEAGAIDEQQEYLIEAGAEGILLEASDIGYSNAVSNLPCTTVQGAIDKIDGKVEELNDKVGITVKTYTTSNYSADTSNYIIFEETTKKRIILNAYFDYDANVVVGAYFSGNNQLRWRILTGGASAGHNVVIEYGEISR